MMRILVVSIFGALLASCSGSSRVEDLLRANAPPYSTTQDTARKSALGNRSSSNTEAGTPAKAKPQEAPRSTAQSPPEEKPTPAHRRGPCSQLTGAGKDRSRG